MLRSLHSTHQAHIVEVCILPVLLVLRSPGAVSLLCVLHRFDLALQLSAISCLQPLPVEERHDVASVSKGLTSPATTADEAIAAHVRFMPHCAQAALE